MLIDMTVRSKAFSKQEWARVQPQYKYKHRVAGLAPPDDQWMQEQEIRAGIIARANEFDTQATDSTLADRGLPSLGTLVDRVVSTHSI